MTLDDWAAAEDLRARCGLLPRRSFEEWEHLWGRNPAGRARGVRPSMGWVLVDDGRVVGGLCNIAVACQYRGGSLTAAVPNSLAVDPEYRGHSLRVVMPYLKQQDVDVLLITTAGPEAGALFGKALKFSPMPYRAHYESLFWVLDARAFSRSLVDRLKLPRPARVAANAVLPALARVVTLARGWRRPVPSGAYSTRVVGADEVGGDFEDLWRRKVESDPRFMESRTPEALRWRFGGPASGDRFKFVCCYRGGTLAGYSVVGRSVHAAGLVKATLCDLFVEGDEGPAVDALLVASRDQAAGGGAAVLEVLGLPASVRARLAAFGPFRRSVIAGEAYPYLYKLAKHVDAPEALRAEGAWYTRANDGDVGL